MKVKYFIILLLMHSCFGQKGTILCLLNPRPGKTTKVSLPWFCESLNYVVGGTDFVYTTSLFTDPPLVLVSVELLNLVLGPTDILSPVITSNTATQATVVVKLITPTTVTEVSNDDVIIHLFVEAN